MTRPWHKRLAESLVLLLLAVAVLNRGGKTLETTWLLAGVASVVTLMSWWESVRGIRKKESGMKGASSISLIHDSKFVIPDAIPPLLWWSAMGFVVWTAASYFGSSTRNYGLDEVLQTASLVLLFLWAMRNLERGTWNLKFPRCLSSLTLLTCAIGVLVYILQPVNRFVGTFADPRFHTDYWPNAFAQFLLLAWPLTAYHVVRSKYQGEEDSPLLRTTRYVLLGFVLGCLLLTYSRGALIAFGGQLVLLAVLTLPTLPSLRTLLPKLLATALFAFLTFFIVNALRAPFFPVQPITEKATFTAAEHGTSVDERRQFWSQAWQLAGEKPILGWGPYSFRFVQPRLQTGVLQTSDHPHNVFLKFAMERGWPAAILFTLIITFAFISMFRREHFAFRISHFEILAAVAASGVLAHNLIDYNLQFVANALPFWLLLGMLVKGPQNRQLPATSYQRQARVELLLALLLLLVTAREGLYLVTSSLGRQAEARSDRATALLWYRRSDPEWFSRDLLLSRAQIEMRGNQFNAAAVSIDRYLRRNAQDTRAWRLSGDVRLHQDDAPRALAAYRRAYELAKWNDLSPVRALLNVYSQDRDQQALRAWKNELLQLLDGYRAAIAANTHFIALGPNPEALLDILRLLQDVYREDRTRLVSWMEEVEGETAEERERLRGRSGWIW